MQSQPAVADAVPDAPQAPPFPWRRFARTAGKSVLLGSLAGLATATIFSFSVGVVMWQEKNIEFDEITPSAYETLWSVAAEQMASGALAALVVFGVFAVAGHYLRVRTVALESAPAEEMFPVSPTVALIRAEREKRRHEES